MEYFVIDLHDTLLRNELGDDSPYVTVGTQFRPHMPHDITEVPLHYSGNFWMAKCAFINTLSRIDALDLGNRYLAEFWLASGQEFEAHHKDCWTMQKDECDPPGLDLYQCMVKRSAYESYCACREERGKEGREGGISLNKGLVNGKLGNFGSL